MLSFWEVTDRAINTGALMKMKDFDMNWEKELEIKTPYCPNCDCEISELEIDEEGFHNKCGREIEGRQ